MQDERRHATCGSRSVTSISSKASRMRTAFSGDVVIRCSSLNHCICSGVPPGMNSEVKICRKAGLSWPQPCWISVDQRLGLLGLSCGDRACAGRGRIRRTGPVARRAPGGAPRRRSRPRTLRDAEQRKSLEAGRYYHGSRSRTNASNEMSPDVPVGQAVAALVVADEPVGRQRAQHGRQTGLCQSYSMWLSQLAVLTIGGRPDRAYAMRTPSDAVQN